MADAATQPASVAAPADLNSLEKRLRKLEAVVGHTPSNDVANVQTLAERLQQVLQALAPVQQNEVARLLRQQKFVERTLAQTTDIALASAVDISVDAKREIVLATMSSLEATAKLLERVDQLKDAARAPDASALRRASGSIDAVQAGHAAQVTEAEWVDSEYAAMLEAYNTNVTLITKVFATWDRLLNSMEKQVDALLKQDA